jgi:hypothetical protein
MKSRTVRAGLAAATSAALLAGVAVAAAEEPPAAASTATITSAVSQASGLRVTGSAALAALEAVDVAEDAAGDSRVPGTDIVGGTIQALGGGKTRFTMEIANMGPGGVTAPGVLHHSWDLSVVTGTNGSDVTLKAINGGAVTYSALEGAGPETPSFAVQNCAPDPQTGQSTCTSTYITGAYSDAGVAFDVPNTLIGLQTGSVVFAGENGMFSNFGASDVIWLSGPTGTEAVSHADYDVPAGDVRIGVAPAGTPLEEVVLTSTVPVKGTAYSVTLPKPAPGDYVVVVQACHGGTCGPLTSKAAKVG